MVISSRTPEGQPNRCPVCGNYLKIEPSDPAGDAPCPHCGHLLWFTWKDLGDGWSIKLSGNLLNPESLDRLFASMEMRWGARLVLDLGDLQYLSSGVLARLINLQRRLRAVGGTVRLQSVHPDLRAVFRATRLDLVFQMET
jgi:anti-anti-sigma factor